MCALSPDPQPSADVAALLQRALLECRLDLASLPDVREDQPCVSLQLLRAECPPRLAITTRKEPADFEQLDATLAGVERVLALRTPFSVHLDFREIRVPSRAILFRGVEWASGQAAAIDEHVQAICIVVPNLAMRLLSDVALRATKPPMPTRVFADEAAALEFARDLQLNFGDEQR